MDPKHLDQIESVKESENFQNSVVRTKLVIDYSQESTNITKKDKVHILIYWTSHLIGNDCYHFGWLHNLEQYSSKHKQSSGKYTNNKINAATYFEQK